MRDDCRSLASRFPTQGQAAIEAMRAAGCFEDQPKYPPLAEQVGSALGAVGRAIGAGLVGLQVVRSGDEIAKCLAICRECEHFVAAEGRCSVCGCYAALKVRLAQEHCPLSEPKW